MACPLVASASHEIMARHWLLIFCWEAPATWFPALAKGTTWYHHGESHEAAYDGHSLSLCYHFVILYLALYPSMTTKDWGIQQTIYIYNIILYLSKVWPGKWCTLWTLSSPINNMSIWNLAKWNQLWCARVVTNLWVRLLQASTHVWSSMGGKKSEMLRNHRSWGNVQFLLVWNILKYGHWGYQQRQEVNLSMSSERPHCRAARPNGASYP